MKPIGVMSTAALFLLFGMAAPANGRQEKPEEKAPPPKQQQQAKPENSSPKPKLRNKNNKQRPQSRSNKLSQKSNSSRPKRLSRNRPNRKNNNRPKLRNRNNPLHQKNNSSKLNSNNSRRAILQSNSQRINSKPAIHMLPSALSKPSQLSARSRRFVLAPGAAAESPTTVSAPILAVDTTSTWATLFSSADIPAFSTAASGLDSSNLGHQAGITPMTSTSITSTAAITCTTRTIPARASPSAS
jgi:hypothetical protein